MSIDFGADLYEEPIVAKTFLKMCIRDSWWRAA